MCDLKTYFGDACVHTTFPGAFTPTAEPTLPVSPPSPPVVRSHNGPCAPVCDTPRKRTLCRRGKTGPGGGRAGGRAWGLLGGAGGTCGPAVAPGLVGPPGRWAPTAGRPRRGRSSGCWPSVSPWPPPAWCSWPEGVGGGRPACTGGSCTGHHPPSYPSGSQYRPGSTSVHRAEWPVPSGFPGTQSRQKSPPQTRQRPWNTMKRKTPGRQILDIKVCCMIDPPLEMASGPRIK